MSLFNLFSRGGTTAPPAVRFDVPASLPKLVRGPDPAALQSMLSEGRVVESVMKLSETLPEADGVRWAADSSGMVKAAQTAPDQAAADAARKWLAAPTPENQAASAKAAAAAGHQGPGAWAAQAAAWAAPQTAPSAASSAPDPLVSQAVKGAVMLAAAMAKPGFDFAQHVKAATDQTGAMADASALASAALPTAAPTPELASTYKPFIDRGLAIAAGKA